MASWVFCFAALTAVIGGYTDIRLTPQSRLSPDARLVQLVPFPGGSPPLLLSTVLQQAVAERLRGREALCEPFAFELDLLADPMLTGTWDHCWVSRWACN